MDEPLDQSVEPLVPSREDTHDEIWASSVTLTRGQNEVLNQGGNAIATRIRRYIVIAKFALVVLVNLLTYSVSRLMSDQLGNFAYLAMIPVTAVSIFLGHRYDLGIGDFFRHRLVTVPNILRSGLASYAHPGKLPASLMLSRHPLFSATVRKYTDTIGFQAADVDVCATLLRDGFNGSIDDLAGIARNLRK